MNKLTRIIGTCSLAALGTLGLAGNGQAATSSGTTSLSVTIPAFAILYYPSSIAVTLADKTDGDGVDTLQDLTYDESTDTMSGEVLPVAAPSNAATITLPKVWAVRGLSSSGNATVAISSSSTTLTKTGGGTIGMSALKVNGSTGSTTVALSGMTAVKGNVGMTLDMSSASQSGQFTGGSYTITVTVL